MIELWFGKQFSQKSEWKKQLYLVFEQFHLLLKKFKSELFDGKWHLASDDDTYESKKLNKKE